MNRRWPDMGAQSIQDKALERLLHWVRQREDEMAALLADLIAVPTENPPGKHYLEFAETLENRAAKLGLEFERIEVISQERAAEDAPPCFSASHGQGERTFYFHGHYDVVPAQSQEQFRPQRKESFVFGRGACDMKGGIVSMLYAILAVRECGLEFDGKINLILVPDEETGGTRGSARLAQQEILGRNGIGMMLAEPTSSVVWDANRGAISLRVRVFGKSAHVGLQHQGENAFERMHGVVGRLQALKREVERRTTSLNIGAGQTPNSILMLGGQSSGGTNFNVVPETCWFTVDRRINPEEDLAEEKARIIDVLKQCRSQGMPLEWEVLQEGESASSHENGPVRQALAHAIHQVTGKPPHFELCPGLLETRFYAAEGVPSYAYGPGLLSVAHGPNEYVDLRRVIECASVYALTAWNVLRPMTPLASCPKL
ncbi:MAG TPA: ArgE/DapE family deacylase [Candidatus Dormibacteraeota bacterium]|nr:ArgE/DapE family deacylase [Candidatus Dormibacteraeota bacterium]